ncbi:unnamed protein product [Ixodes hexagonus]
MADEEVGDSNLSSIVDNVAGLTEEEKIQLLSVMIKAKELDAQEENKMRQPLEGQLFKYTNVVKGWQYRWFVLNPDIGMFEYYMLDELKKGRPRGAVHLAGAVISPSDEDGQMFTVSAACGEVYKLRGHDAKERQFWINRLRKVAEDHTKTIAQKNPPLLPREIRGPHEGAVASEKGSAGTGQTHQGGSTSTPVSQTVWYTTVVGAPTEATTTPAEAFTSVREILARAGRMYHCLARSIESLPSHGPGYKFYDRDMLVLKATSCATVMCLEQCLTILQEHKAQAPTGLPAGSTVEWLEPHCSAGDTDGSDDAGISGDWSQPPPHIPAGGCPAAAVVGANSSGEVSDGESEEEDAAIPTEENKDSILQLLSKLKLGMDLTKACDMFCYLQVTLPSYILEPRSLLEVYADFMSYPDLFVRIADGPTPEERLVRVVEWFLSSLYATRKASCFSHSARKPYNPVLGEMFHCSWRVPGTGDTGVQVTFVAEQVSHHPPVLFVLTPNTNCAELFARLHLKKLFLCAPFGKKYMVFQGKHKQTWRNFRCTKLTPGWRAFLEAADARATLYLRFTFSLSAVDATSHPSLSSTGRVAERHGNVADLFLWTCYINSLCSRCDTQGSTREWSVIEQRRQRKRCRPVDAQDVCESRRLWRPVTQALRSGDLMLASHHKFQIEERQRELTKGKENPETGTSPQAQDAKLFRLEGNTWKYKYILSKSS